MIACLEGILELQRYILTRPYVYHLTHIENLSHLRELRQLFPAAMLMRRAGRLDLVRTPRPGPIPLTVDGRTIILRDQKPLHKGNIKLPKGFSFEDFIESLNKRIFFWPGDMTRPIPYGVRHFEHYKAEGPAILRIEFTSLLESNPSATPRFCQYNSGSPRCSHGKKIPRGPSTFPAATEFVGTAGRVVEVTFEREIHLPPTAQFGVSPNGPWKNL